MKIDILKFVMGFLFLTVPCAAQQITVTCPPNTVPVAAINGTTVTISCNNPQPPPPPLKLITPVSFPQAKVGVLYDVNLAALANVSGGVPPYKFTSTSPASWWSLSSTGVITGVPTVAGNFNVSFVVTDSSVSVKGKNVSGGKLHASSVASSSSVHVSH
jgi:hypothetical protein